MECRSCREDLNWNITGYMGLTQQSDTWGPRIWGYWLVYGKNDDKPLGLGVPNVQTVRPKIVGDRYVKW